MSPEPLKLRRVRLAISTHLAGAIFGEFDHHYRVTRDAVPITARIIGCSLDMSRGIWWLLLEDESFPATNEGCEVPEICPIFTTVEPGK